MFKRFWWMFLVMLPVGALVGLLLAGVVTYRMPKIYESEAIIEVKPRTQRTDDESGVPRGPTPQFLATEFEKLTSRQSREKIADGLELVKRWNLDRESVLGVLKKIITTQSIKGTDLISVRVRHIDKVDARDIAADAARAYKEYREEIESREAGRYLQELNKAVRDQEDKVEERRKVLSIIVRTQGIIPKGAEIEVSQGTGGAPEDATKRHLAAQDHADAKREFETDQELLQKLKLKQIGETISAKIPAESVMIHDIPVIAESPVSPNVTLNLLLGAVLGLFLSPFLALPAMWLMHRGTSANA